VAFEQQFGAVLREIDATLASAARREAIYRDLVAREDSIARLRAEGRSQDAPDPDGVLLALVSADPEFYRLHSQIRALDAELASTGNVPSEFRALAQRVSGSEAPRAALGAPSPSERSARLSTEIGAAQAAVDALHRDQRTHEREKAPKAELAPLRAARQQLDSRLSELQRALRALVRTQDSDRALPSASELAARFEEDRAYVERLRAAASGLRAELETAAGAAGERALRDLRERLAQELRRARIGRIDAVMGSKRQVELQIESLAAGRFPPELVDPLHVQSLLRDDEEYWPFEGEDWPDEFVERYGDEGERE
jgi:hypothetical protein